MFYAERKKGPQSESFWGDVEQLVKQGKSRESAIEATVIADPERHAAMIREANANR